MAPRNAGEAAIRSTGLLASLLWRGLGDDLRNRMVSVGVGGVWVWVPLAGWRAKNQVFLL